MRKNAHNLFGVNFLGNILVGQSGGPTSVINASLYGVISEALANSDKFENVYGMINGIEGFAKGNYINLGKKLSAEDLQILKNTPSAFLGSCRYKLPENLNDDVYSYLFSLFEKLDITAMFYIGGNDSMDTVAKLSAYAKKNDIKMQIIGIPKTIDNDLIKTDHTPGYGSAAKFVATAVRDISMDAHVYNTVSVTIVEIMGRNAGWLTAASVLARKYGQDNPALIYLPEVSFSVHEFYADVEREMKKRGNVIVCVSEGIKDENGVFICEYAQQVETDTFGHKNLTGCGKQLENMVRAKFGVKTRSVELNVTQRCVSSIASLTDIEEAAAAASYAVKAAIRGETGIMVSCERKNGEKYALEYKGVDVSEVCNKEKTFPVEWIVNKNDISEKFIEYAEPIIMGEVERKIENGLPKYCYLEQFCD